MLLAWNALAIDTAGPGTEEFAGPFPSWRNLQTDYHAAGNGQTDDTVALQRALDDLTVHANFCVLFIPAGTYRLTSTVRTVRRKHTDCQGIAIVGDSPESTMLRWDGPNGGTVFQYDAWYSKISRLTIDGASRAQIALHYGPAFSTYNETSDLSFRNAAIGILFGSDKSQGQAENEVLRCRFFGCTDAGIKTANFNSMDIWVWYSRFEGCGHALFNGAGNFHAWQSLFVNSSVADIGSANLMVFSFVNNTSIGSRRFLDFESGHTWGSPMTVSGNRILNPTDDFPLRLGDGGPYLIMDNVFKLPAGSCNQAAKMTWGDQTFIGNSYTTTNEVKENGRFRRVAESVIDSRAIDAALPTLPPAPPRRSRTIIEVPAGADAATIQKAIDQAARLRGQRPVVHLPMGNYKIAKTLVIPAESDVQLVGDSAGETGSRLDWTGPAGGLLLELEGPARATLKDLYLGAPNARAMAVENADQPGGKIFADQFNVGGPTRLRKNSGQGVEAIPVALRVNGLVETDVLFRCLQGSGNAGTWVEVNGQNSVVGDHNQISIFTGAASSADGQYMVRNGGRLVVRSVYHEKSTDTPHGLYLSDSGTLAIDACRFSCRTSPETPLVSLQNFHGMLTLATSELLPVDATNTCRFEITGNGADTSALAIDDLFWVYEPEVTSEKVWLNKALPPAHGGLMGCNMNTQRQGIFKTGGFGFLDNLVTHNEPVREAIAGAGQVANSLSDAELLNYLAPLRTARVWLPGDTPEHVTDLRIYRIMVRGDATPVVEFSAGHRQPKTGSANGEHN